MTYTINSLVSVADIEFGFTVDQVRKLMGNNYSSFKRTTASDFPCDYYESAGIFVYYKNPGVVEAVEFTKQAHVSFEETNLSELSFSELKSLLLEKDSGLEIEVDSITSYKLGIGAYAPNAETNPSNPAESLIVFEQGYYE